MPYYDEKPPYMPPGWIAIPKAALKQLNAQAMIGVEQLARLNDPEAYKHHARVRMFVDIANGLQCVYESMIDVKSDRDGERWNLTIWCIDPDYVAAQEKRLRESRSTETAKPT